MAASQRTFLPQRRQDRSVYYAKPEQSDVRLRRYVRPPLMCLGCPAERTPLQRQHRQGTLRRCASLPFLLQLVPSDLRYRLGHSLPHPLRDRSRPILPSDPRRRRPAQVPEAGAHPLDVLPCAARAGLEDERFGRHERHLHDRYAEGHQDQGQQVRVQRRTDDGRGASQARRADSGRRSVPGLLSLRLGGVDPDR